MGNKIEMFKGDHEDFEVEILDKNDEAVPLTGAWVIFSVKLNYTDEIALIEKKNTAAGGEDSEIEMTDPINGIFEIHLLPEDTSELIATLYIYDVQVKLSTGKVKTTIENRLLLKEDVTK